jgi:Ni,Fe-hydrogenase III small subunit
MSRLIAPFCLALLLVVAIGGCASEGKTIKKIAKPIGNVSDEIGKVREVRGSAGQTRAVLAPQEEKKLRIPF